jgi:hypothetical protein
VGAAQVAPVAAPKKRELDGADAAPPPAKRLLTLDPATLPPKKRPLPPDPATLPPKKRPRPPALTAWAGAPEAAADAGATGSCNSKRHWIRWKGTARPCPRSTPTAWRPPRAPFRVPHCVPGAKAAAAPLALRVYCMRAEQVCSAAPAARLRPARVLIQPAARRARSST